MSKDAVFMIIKVLFFFFCLFLVVYGQATVGRWYLGMQLFGLAGLLFLLWNYNRKFV